MNPGRQQPWIPNTSRSCSLNTLLTQTSLKPTSHFVARTTVCSPRAGYALGVTLVIWFRLENAPSRAAETLHNLFFPLLVTLRQSLACETTFFAGLRALPAARRDITVTEPLSQTDSGWFRSCLKDCFGTIAIVKNELQRCCCFLSPLCCVFSLVRPLIEKWKQGLRKLWRRAGRERIQMAYCSEKRPKFETTVLKLLTAYTSNTSAAFCSARKDLKPRCLRMTFC